MSHNLALYFLRNVWRDEDTLTPIATSFQTFAFLSTSFFLHFQAFFSDETKRSLSPMFRASAVQNFPNFATMISMQHSITAVIISSLIHHILG